MTEEIWHITAIQNGLVGIFSVITSLTIPKIDVDDRLEAGIWFHDNDTPLQGREGYTYMRYLDRRPFNYRWS